MPNLLNAVVSSDTADRATEVISYLPHGLNFSICLLVIYVAIKNYRINRYTHNQKLRWMLNWAIGFQIGTMIAFMTNQSIWIINNHEDAVGVMPSMAWLAYDYLNSIFHLSAGLLMTNYIKGRCTC